MKLIFFGKLADIAGLREKEFTASADMICVNDVIDALTAEDDLLGAALKSSAVRVAVNEEIRPRDTMIDQSAVLAFLPPVSGG